ncbi:MAG: cob(I)yrinic acid a,c-diamide adenosyltransferase [Flavobacteriaceae bacterium]|nr:cob(I)yrinic acid a,c-diamide adenosyltransferase [Flavobacteriaceae bacterium]
MKIYTKTGDKGETSLFGGTRVPKYDDRIEAYGTVDELNAYIGLIRDQKVTDSIKENLRTVQNDLFTLGAMLATPKEKETLKNGKKRLNIPKINQSSVLNLENQIDLMNKDLKPMTNFILPGGHTTVSYCHIARCVCRRAERLVVRLSEEQVIDNNIIMYLNRLSDYLFVLARKLTLDNQVKETPWKPQKR